MYVHVISFKLLSNTMTMNNVMISDCFFVMATMATSQHAGLCSHSSKTRRFPPEKAWPNAAVSGAVQRTQF